MYLIDQESKSPLHIQLYSELKKDIIDNLQVGDKLPSIRKLANGYNLSKTTVQSAYNQLYAEGYIEARPKSGYFVSDDFVESFKTNEPPQSTPKETKTYKYDFFPARLHKDDFPLKLWKRLFAKAMDESIDMGGYSDGQGELGLREAIANYLRESRALRCSAEQVVITGAFMDGMSMIADLLQTHTKEFAIENPGYHIARKVFERFGYTITKIAVNEDGLDIDALENSKAKVVYITPSHQYPTGVAMPIANRQRLLEWAEKNDGYIIEDDYDSELTYRSRPIPSLQGLDNDDRVIYIGTFAKALSPALRVGYIVLPYRLRQHYQSFHIHFPRVALTTQKTLELFMKEGHWERHLRRVRNSNRKKHDLMKSAILKHLGDKFEIVSEGGGLSINIQPKEPINLAELEQKAQNAEIKLYLASRTSGGDWEALRMGFGGFKEEEIEEAIIALTKIWL